MYDAHLETLSGEARRDSPVAPLPRAGGRGAGRQRVPAPPVGRRGRPPCRGPRGLGRLRAAALHAQGGVRRGPGRASALRHQPDVSPRALRPRAPDLGDHGHAHPLARDAGVVGVVGALLGLRAPRRRGHAGRPRLRSLLVRPLHRLLGGLRGRAGARRARHSRRRPGLAHAPGRRWRPWARPSSCARRRTPCT